MRKSKDSPRQVIDDIQALESRAHALGMTLTGHALNRAKNVAGWTMAGNDKAAIQAMSGEAPH